LYLGDHCTGDDCEGLNGLQQENDTRNAILESLEDLRKYANGEYNEADASDNEREMRIHLEYENRIWGILKQNGVKK
jgi:hypothetical protein